MCVKKSKCCPSFDQYGANARIEFPTLVSGSICKPIPRVGEPYDFEQSIGDFTTYPDGSFSADSSTGLFGVVNFAISTQRILAGFGGRVDVVLRPDIMNTQEFIVGLQNVSNPIDGGFFGSKGLLLRPTGEITFEPYYGNVDNYQTGKCDKLSIVSDGVRVWIEVNDEEVYTYTGAHLAEMYVYVGMVDTDITELFDIRVTVNT